MKIIKGRNKYYLIGRGCTKIGFFEQTIKKQIDKYNEYIKNITELCFMLMPKKNFIEYINNSIPLWRRK